MLHFAKARNRRRFYLERGLRRRPFGGSNLQLLMNLPREEAGMKPEDIFGDIPAIVVGGVATRAYAPERQTKDIDFLIEHDRFVEVMNRLRTRGWTKTADLHFPNASLGLRGVAWEKDGALIDVLTTDQEWGTEAFQTPAYDQTGLRVIPLAYLVLMKIDSARGIDQGDLTRMLGRLEPAQIEEIVSVVDRHAHDPQAADDVRQYFLLGQMEWGRTSDTD